MRKLFISLLIAVTALSGCCDKVAETQFYRVEHGQIMLGDAPQYFVGANFWKGAVLATEDPGRLARELDSLKAIGVTNLRILAVDPVWEGYDALFEQLRSRGMCAVMFMNNAWDWSRGFAYYLEEAGAGRQPVFVTDGYAAYRKAMAEFSNNTKAQELSWEHVRAMVERYKDEPAVFSWQISNEPRCFTDNPATKANFVKYIHNTAALIKSMDPNHMVSTGNEGTMGCEEDYDLYKRINDCADIDYITIHIWPYNWSWIREHNVVEGAPDAAARVDEYITQHLQAAGEYGKPLIIEEFGYPRDGFRFEQEAPVTGRDLIYKRVFDRILQSAATGDKLAGCNFWTWAIDPPQEPQGLNAVLSGDSTVELIRSTNAALKATPGIHSPIDLSLVKTGEGPFSVKATVTCEGADECTISFKLLRDTTLMKDVKEVAWEQSRTVALKKGRAEVEFTFDAAPGCYQVNLSHCQPFNILVNPEQIVSPQTKQPDFDSFWENTLAELAAVAPEYELVPDPEMSDSTRQGYVVKMKSLGGETIGGYYIEPVKPGKYPAIIDYMGYGAVPYKYSPQEKPETIQFLVSVRGQGIFLEPDHTWIDRGFESKETAYYRGAFCDVVRAIDFICSREKTDPEHIFAEGESQGGAFTWIAGALDHRVKAIAPAVPFLSDYEDYAKIVYWPMHEVFEAAEACGVAREDLMKVFSYFDIKNFTDRIQCPVYMAFGLQDPVCPPHTNFAGFNMVKSEKHWFCVPTCGHSMWKEASWTKEREDWFASMMKNF